MGDEMDRQARILAQEESHDSRRETVDSRFDSPLIISGCTEIRISRSRADYEA